MKKIDFAKKAAFFAMSVCVSTAYAGRPMLVDDANTNEAGHGHLESWFDKENNALSFSPAYAPIEELELGANFTNSQLTSEKAYSFQMKKLFTSSQQNGCNTGGTLGRSAVTNDSGYSIYGWGILTCNSINWGTVHANLGWDKPNTSSANVLYGVAYEYPLENLVPNIEWMHVEGSENITSIGLRTEIIKNVQLDGSYRIQGDNKYWTLGGKLQF